METINEFLDYTLFSIGNSSVKVQSLLILLVSVFLLFYLSEKLKKLLESRFLARYIVDIGVRTSIATIIKYLILILGFYIILKTSGIDLSGLGLLAGALGVGIGFGLQNITNNFISGLIILFERPIKVGDRVEVGDVNGDIVKISARATTVVTNDNISIIVPNSEFISNRVINWSHNDSKVRFKIPVGVSYNEDPQKIRKILIEVASKHPGVLANPKPNVWFNNYGDSSLDFNLLVWTTKFIHRPGAFKSELYFDIFEKFKEHNVEIPFPQRDLHIRSGIEKIKAED